MAEIDEDMIQRGSAPPILLQYDRQLLALIIEGADIWAKHDVVRGHELGAKIDAIMAARNEAQKPYEAASAERAHEAAVRAAEAGASANFERCTGWGEETYVDPRSVADRPKRATMRDSGRSGKKIRTISGSNK